MKVKLGHVEKPILRAYVHELGNQAIHEMGVRSPQGIHETCDPDLQVGMIHYQWSIFFGCRLQSHRPDCSFPGKIFFEFSKLTRRTLMWGLPFLLCCFGPARWRRVGTHAWGLFTFG
jgi:hypothetical protein